MPLRLSKITGCCTKVVLVVASHFVCLILLLIAYTTLLVACGTIPDAEVLVHTNPLYLVSPQFVGPDGPLTTRQASRVILRLKQRQKLPSDILQRHIAFEQALTNVPLMLDNKVTLLKNGATTYRAMLNAIHGATDSINLETYIFSDAQVGRTFSDALIERQRHGVKVNVSYDAFGSIGTPAGFFNRMRRNGITVLEYLPLNPFETTLRWSPSHRDHRKMLIIDGRIAFTGGINISEDYASGLRSGTTQIPLGYWRDTDVKIEGPAVAEFQHIFIDDWVHQKGPLLKPRNYFPKLKGEGKDIVRVIASVPERFNPIYVTLISAITNAETNIYITDAYFAPDRQMLRALARAARRGVDVRLLLPSRSDVPIIMAAQRSHYTRLLKAGVKIYEWRGEMLHAKTATIDGVWSTVGTSNLDWWSIARDNEVNAVILSHHFARDMNMMFASDLEGASQITLGQWAHRGLCERLYETAGRIIQPLL
jgi:cardiolipin synthase